MAAETAIGRLIARGQARFREMAESAIGLLVLYALVFLMVVLASALMTTISRAPYGVFIINRLTGSVTYCYPGGCHDVPQTKASATVPGNS